jgi:hypothetical protein
MKPSPAELTRQLQATKHRKRGRTWDYLPHERTEGRDPYLINPLSLRISTGRTLGRWERHTNSRTALHRLHAIGKTHRFIFDAKIGSERIPYNCCIALEHYLWASKGLTYFRRIQPTGYTASVLCDLLSRIGIPTHNVIRPQPTDQVSTGLEDALGVGADRQRSQPRGQRGLSQ